MAADMSLGIQTTSTKFLKKRLFLLIVTITATVVYGLLYYREAIKTSSNYKFSTTINYLKGYQPIKSSLADSQSDTNSNNNNNSPDIRDFHKWKLPLSSSGQNLKDVEMSYFWSGNNFKDYLIKGFNIDSKDGLATLCVVLVGSAILYEGLRTLRDYLLNRFVDRRKQWRILENRLRLHGNDDSSPIGEIGSGEGPSGSRGRISTSLTSHYGGGDGAGDSASASLMTSPVEDDDDYELNSSKQNVPKKTSSSRILGGSTIGNFSTPNRTEQFHAFSLLVISTLIHMIYITLGYIFMLSVMTFNVWILVAVAIGVGIGQFLFGVFRRTDNCIKEPSLLTGNTNSSDTFNTASPSSNPSGSNSQNRVHSLKQVQEEEEKQDVEGEMRRIRDIKIKNKNLTPARNCDDGNVQSDYYSNSSSSCYSGSSGSDNQRSEKLTTTEISVHNVSTPDSYPKNAI